MKNSTTNYNNELLAPPNGINLPFRVRIVRTEEHLSKAIDVRKNSYGRHDTNVSTLLQQPEDADKSQIILLAESKFDNSALGTMRIETNQTRHLPIEKLLPKNTKFDTKTIAFITRLAINQNKDSGIIKLTLYKALLRYCLACQIDWMILTARPPMDKHYASLGFEDVKSPKELFLIPWTLNIPMRIMALETIKCEQLWRETNHEIYAFMFTDQTPDIEIFNSLSGKWSRPRTRVAPDYSSCYDQPTEKDLLMV
jgi:hypothetical protein